MDGLINAASASQAFSCLNLTSMMTGGATTNTDVKDSHRIARVVHDTFTSNTSGRRLFDEVVTAPCGCDVCVES